MEEMAVGILKRLLPFLEQSLAPLLPVSFKLEEKGNGLPLEFRGNYLGNLVLSSDGLSQEELSRWKPTVLALAHELLNRLLNENLIEGLPGPRLLANFFTLAESAGESEPPPGDPVAFAPGEDYIAGFTTVPIIALI